VTKTRPIDFDIYDFNYQGKIILSAYAGNAPSFPFPTSDFVGIKEQRSRLDGLPARSFAKRTVGGLVSREVLIDLSSRQNVWPQFVHLWYFDLQEQDAKLADEMIITTTYGVGAEDDHNQGGGRSDIQPRGRSCEVVGRKHFFLRCRNRRSWI
jgi:hypothetical protein